jgi:predicted rRNA methylase YqxC with S4 and FtsJ domains
MPDARDDNATATPTNTLLDRLAADLPTAKRQTLRRMIADGRVRVNGVRATRATQQLNAEDKIQISDQPARAAHAGAERSAAKRRPGSGVLPP